MQTSMERLSSGMRINSAADDAAGLAVANKMHQSVEWYQDGDPELAGWHLSCSNS